MLMARTTCKHLRHRPHLRLSVPTVLGDRLGTAPLVAPWIQMLISRLSMLARECHVAMPVYHTVRRQAFAIVMVMRLGVSRSLAMIARQPSLTPIATANLPVHATMPVRLCCHIACAPTRVNNATVQALCIMGADTYLAHLIRRQRCRS